jgi:hypothetical protein
MDPNELFVGRKVWLKPNPLIKHLYPDPYFETEITYVGLKLFQIRDPNKADYVNYRIKNLTENVKTPQKGVVLLSIDGLEDFDRREQKIIRVRKYFNSRAVYNETESNLDAIIDILKV